MKYLIINPISGSAMTRNPVILYYMGGDGFTKHKEVAMLFDLEDAKATTRRLKKDNNKNDIFYAKK
jgi:hypothetical protein